MLPCSRGRSKDQFAGLCLLGSTSMYRFRALLYFHQVSIYLAEIVLLVMGRPWLILAPRLTYQVQSYIAPDTPSCGPLLPSKVPDTTM